MRLDNKESRIKHAQNVTQKEVQIFAVYGNLERACR
jgi:hypothetical protein